MAFEVVAMGDPPPVLCRDVRELLLDELSAGTEVVVLCCSVIQVSGTQRGIRSR
jgi:hypothetical protein